MSEGGPIVTFVLGTLVAAVVLSVTGAALLRRKRGWTWRRQGVWAAVFLALWLPFYLVPVTVPSYAYADEVVFEPPAGGGQVELLRDSLYHKGAGETRGGDLREAEDGRLILSCPARCTHEATSGGARFPWFEPPYELEGRTHVEVLGGTAGAYVFTRTTREVCGKSPLLAVVTGLACGREAVCAWELHLSPAAHTRPSRSCLMLD